MPTVSLVIPCHDVLPTLPLTLAGVLSQDFVPSELLFLDDDSRDGTGRFLDELAGTLERPRLEVIHLGHNLGLAAIRNLGLRRSKGSLVAFLDADCCPHPNWLSLLVAHHAQRTAVSPTHVLTAGRLIERHRRGILAQWRLQHLAQDPGPSVRTLPHFYGSNFLASREHLLGIGGFHEHLRNNFEDIDLSIRLRHHGLTFETEPSALVFHDRPPSLRALIRGYRSWYLDPLQLLAPNKPALERILTAAALGWRHLRLDVDNPPTALLLTLSILFLAHYPDLHALIRRGIR